MPKRSLPTAAAGSASVEPPLQRRCRDPPPDSKVVSVTVDGGGEASGIRGPLVLIPAPGEAESNDSEVATVAVDGGGQTSGSHGPLDLLPAPGGDVAQVAVDSGGLRDRKKKLGSPAPPSRPSSCILEMNGMRGALAPLELEPAAAAVSVITLERAGENLFRATVADDRVLSVDADILKTMPQGQARLGTLLAQELMQTRKALKRSLPNAAAGSASVEPTLQRRRRDPQPDSEVLTVTVDGGGQASGTHGSLALVPAPSGTPVAGSAAAPAADAADDARDIGPAPERGLVIAKQWMSEILAGRKTLEIRNRNHSCARQRVYLVEKTSGLVRGTAMLGESRNLTAAEHASNHEALEFCQYKTPVAWPLLLVTLFDRAWVTTGTARSNCHLWILRYRWEQYPSNQPEDFSQLLGGTLVVPVADTNPDPDPDTDPTRSLPAAAAGSASGEPSLQRRRRDPVAGAIAPPTNKNILRRDRSKAAAVAVDGGGQASVTHGPLDLVVPAPGGEVAKVAVEEEEASGVRSQEEAGESLDCETVQRDGLQNTVYLWPWNVALDEVLAVLHEANDSPAAVHLYEGPWNLPPSPLSWNLDYYKVQLLDRLTTWDELPMDVRIRMNEDTCLSRDSRSPVVAAGGWKLDSNWSEAAASPTTSQLVHNRDWRYAHEEECEIKAELRAHDPGYFPTPTSAASISVAPTYIDSDSAECDAEMASPLRLSPAPDPFCPYPFAPDPLALGTLLPSSAEQQRRAEEEIDAMLADIFALTSPTEEMGSYEDLGAPHSDRYTEPVENDFLMLPGQRTLEDYGLGCYSAAAHSDGHAEPVENDLLMVPGQRTLEDYGFGCYRAEADHEHSDTLLQDDMITFDISRDGTSESKQAVRVLASVTFCDLLLLMDLPPEWGNTFLSATRQPIPMGLPLWKFDEARWWVRGLFLCRRLSTPFHTRSFNFCGTDTKKRTYVCDTLADISNRFFWNDLPDVRIWSDATELLRPTWASSLVSQFPSLRWSLRSRGGVRCCSLAISVASLSRKTASLN